MENPGRRVTPTEGARLVTPVRVRRARLGAGSVLRGWAVDLDPLTTESAWSKLWARTGVIASIVALVVYVTWRIVFTLPPSGWNLVAAWLFHTPPGAVAGLPDGTPAVAAERVGTRRSTATLARHYRGPAEHAAGELSS